MASNAQADTAPSGRCLLHDVAPGGRTGARCDMAAEHLQAWDSHSKGWRMCKIQFNDARQQCCRGQF
eukprot:7511025-Heterocapsa_arctica.AAC.1